MPTEAYTKRSWTKPTTRECASQSTSSRWPTHSLCFADGGAGLSGRLDRRPCHPRARRQPSGRYLEHPQNRVSVDRRQSRAWELILLLDILPRFQRLHHSFEIVLVQVVRRLPHGLLR